MKHKKDNNLKNNSLKDDDLKDNDLKDNDLYFIDVPCSEKKDAIGYSTYVDSLQSALNTKAKMIGIISNYGSGKSTILNMLKDRESHKKNEKICFINLWNIPANRNRNKVNEQRDYTINIHKSFLNQLINDLDFERHKKKYLQKQINKNYSFIDIAVENKNFIIPLYLLLVLTIFTIVLKVDLPDTQNKKISILILEMAIAVNFVYLLIKSKIYFSFNKESKNNREIDEFETIECFSEILSECKIKKIEKLIICIEDIDRFTNETETIRFLEQIYKFYNEANHVNDIDVKFIITIKPASCLEDELNKIKKKVNNDSIKNIYEKIFDFIINLQPVSIQNYDALINELLKPKCDELKKIGIDINSKEDNYFLMYLYRGKSVTIRDIKHRYNYAISLYMNLMKHNSTVSSSSLSIEKCFYVAYLEDEFSREFYSLINDPNNFESMVINYLMNHKIRYCESCELPNECGVSTEENVCKYSGHEKFIEEIKYGFEQKLIDSTYSMYFFKFPKGKEIKNIYNQGINDSLLRNNFTSIQHFNECANNCDEEEIILTMKRLIEAKHMPTIIFNNKRLFEITYDRYIKELEELILSYDIVTERNKTLQMLEDIRKIGGLKSNHCLDIYIKENAQKLKSELEESTLIDIRKRILYICEGLPLIYKVLYDETFPAITKDEMKIINDINITFNLINSNQITNDMIGGLSELDLSKVNAKDYLSFLEKITNIDSQLFKEIIYTFKPHLFKMSKQNKRKISSNSEYIEKLSLNNPDEILNFCELYMFIPVNLEKEFINSTFLMTNEEKKVRIERYVNLLKNINHISIHGLKFLDEYNNKYEYNEIIEKEMLDKGKYHLYVYSKASRTETFGLDDDETAEKLEEAYKYYFINEKELGKKIIPTLEMLRYLSKKIDINDLPVEKRNLFNVFPQTYSDVEYIIKNKDNNYINNYLKRITKFDSNNEQKIFNIIYMWASNGERMESDTYQSLKKIINKRNSTKFGTLKSKKKLLN